MSGKRSGPAALSTGRRREITGDQIRSASLVLAIAAGTLTSCIVEAYLLVTSAGPATDPHGDMGFAALSLVIVSPAVALINVCLCLPLVWIADKFAGITTSTARRMVGLHRPALLLSSLTLIACAATCLTGFQRSSAAAGCSFIIVMAVRDDPLPYSAGVISAVAVYHSIARWMVEAAST